MKSGFGWFAFVFVLSVISPAHAQTYASELNLGVQAYKNARYEEAITHFREATELDPSQPVAHLYLATAYVSQYIPGVESKDNLQCAEEAIEQYESVLNSDATNADQKMNSTKGIAYLYLNMKKWDEAKQYYLHASTLDPNDPEPHYSIGVIDWTRCYQPRMEARARLGMKPDEHLNAKNWNQKKVCDELMARNAGTIEEGIDNLNEAIQLRPDYDDAMAYMNLMYREKADLECYNQVARARDLRTADEWVDKTMAVKKAKAEKSR